MKLKANHNLVLPNGKTVKVGEVFEYEGGISSFAGCVEVISEDKQPKKDPKTPDENPQEKAIRELAKKLGIKNWHTKGIEKLKEEIKEKEVPAPTETIPANDENKVEDDKNAQN